ncbi:MAG: hypothetical protein AB9M53_00900 [Leptothrix sp. (in: b-proteobacteria)]
MNATSPIRMPIPVDPNATGQIAEIVGSAAVAAAGFVFGLQKLIRMFGSSRTDYTRTAAQNEVVDSMRKELRRMTEQNGKMAEALNSLQLEVVNLRSENADLHTTVRHLHAEVRRLRKAGATSDFAPLEDLPN